MPEGVLPEDEYEHHVRRHMSTDETRLAELGYKQELKRDWSLMHNFGVSFSIIVRSSSPLCVASV